MPEDNYHDIPAVSCSTLKNMFKSPLHYWKNSPFNPDRIVQKETPALLFGKIVHKCILERDVFFDEFIVSPKIDKRTKQGKLDYEAFEKESKGLTIITQDQYDLAESMAIPIRKDDFVKKIINVEGEFEKEIFWEEDGIPCKAKIDHLSSLPFITDYKTTESAHPEDFINTVKKYGYHMQDAWYRRGLKKALDIDALGFGFIVQEKVIHEAFGFYLLGEGSREVGEREALRALDGIKRHLDLKQWPGFPKKFVTIDLPDYYREKTLDIEDYLCQ